MKPQINAPITQACVIIIDGRYFSKFGKKGQVQTAWSLAGAELFLNSLEPVLKKLDEKGKKYRVELVELNERRHGFELREYYRTSYRLKRTVNNAASVGEVMGYTTMANQVSMMTAQLIIMEKELKAQSLKAILDNVSSNTSIWYEPKNSRFNFLPLKDRLALFKRGKKFEAYMRGELTADEAGFCADYAEIPF